MQQNVKRAGSALDRKIISISMKHQLTIPQRYYETLGFDNEAECILQEGGLLIRPVRSADGGEFSAQILADLLSQGYEGQELLDKFKQYSEAIQPAVQKMLRESVKYARNGNGRIPIDGLFGTEA